MLLHGLGRTPLSFAGLARWLRRRGFRVLNVGYPSRRRTVAELAEHVGAVLARRLPDGTGTLHFVTHSLGGIVLRAMLVGPDAPRVGRAVMLVPPNRGNELADLLRNYRAFRAVLGPTLDELGTGEDDLPRSLPPVDFELGVIAGGRSRLRVFDRLVPEPHDGIVSAESARVEGMRDFLVVPRDHTFIMNAPEVREQIAAFLRDGRFRR